MYAETRPEELTLRDHLARDRTLLANERTLLAYMRTGFGFIAGGGTLVKFFPEDMALRVIGFALVAAGVVTAVAGVVRFFQIRARMKLILKQPMNSQ
ncbi:MAG: YidH family protein [Aureliella sp.]